MLEVEKKSATERKKELFFGHLVTWGSIVFAVALIVGLSQVSAMEKDPPQSPLRRASPAARADVSYSYNLRASSTSITGMPSRIG